VLAIDGNYKPPVDQKSPTPMSGAVATLELTPRDAEILAMADKMGDVALALRGVRSEAGEVVAGSSRRQGGGTVKIHKFGSVSDVAVASAGAR
jgi:pilus assembly protein CpaB